MKTLNEIERNPTAVMSRAYSAVYGAETAGAEIGLPADTAINLRLSLEDYAGRPKGALNSSLGKLEECAVCAETLYNARVWRKEMEKKARKMVLDCKNLLRHYLGQRWTMEWTGPGFLAGSLAAKEDPAKVLICFRAYFSRHPEQENPKLELTAVHVDAMQTELLESRRALRHAITEWKQAISARDQSFRVLRQRLTSLRTELKIHLGPEDPRWLLFAFRPPADSRIPGPVEEVTVRDGLPGEVFVQWTAALRAENYRVSCVAAGADLESAPVLDCKLVGNLEAILRGLPVGVPLCVMVSAVNSAGETKPTAIKWEAPPPSVAGVTATK